MHSLLIIGCGSIGERHVRCFQRTGRVVVTACDANPTLLQRMADTYGVATRPDAFAALAEPFDAVVICTPAPLHLPLATQALAAGKHVLVEKPLSHSLDGLDALERTLASSGRQLAVAYVYHVFPALREARAFLSAGAFGPVLQAVASCGQAFNLARPAYAQTYYRDRRTGGGAIQDALTHVANWVEHILGPADSVLADCAHLSLADVDVEDTVHIAARHGATLVSYALNQFQAPNQNTLQFNAAGGSVRIELHRDRWGVFPVGATDWTWHDCAPVERDTHFIAQANAFLDQIEGRPSRLCSLAAAVQTLRFNLAALASAESGTRVFCRDVRA